MYNLIIQINKKQDDFIYKRLVQTDHFSLFRCLSYSPNAIRAKLVVFVSIKNITGSLEKFSDILLIQGLAVKTLPLVPFLT